MTKSGTNYTAKWTLDDEGVLTISPKSGTSGILRYKGNDSVFNLNTYVGLTADEAAGVTSIVFEGSITFQYYVVNSYESLSKMDSFFVSFGSVATIDVTGLDTGAISSASSAFAIPTLTEIVGSATMTFATSGDVNLSSLFEGSKLTELDLSGISQINTADITNMVYKMAYCERITFPTSMKRTKTNEDGWVIFNTLGIAGGSAVWDENIPATNANGITITTDEDFFKLPSGQQGGTWTRDISKSASLTANVNSATRSANTATISLTYACTSAEISIYVKKSSEADYPSEADLTQSITGTGTLSLELELSTDDAYDMQITVSDGTTNLYFFPSVDSNILLAEIDESGALKVNGLTIGDYEHIAPDYQQNYDDPGTKSLASGTSWTDTGCTLTLGEGIWMVTAAIYYPNPSNGSTVSARACRVYNHQSGDSIGYIATDQRAGRNDYASTAHTTFPIKITADEAPTKLEVQGYQNSGKSLTTRPRLYAARIG